MVQAHSEPQTCRQCGCPMAGNENYCSSCGRRVDARFSLRKLGVINAALILVSLAAAATCVYRHRLLPEPRAGPTPVASPLRAR